MTDLNLVDVLNPWDKLLKKFACLVFLQSLSLDYVIKQFSSAGVLHDQKQLSGSFNDLYSSQIFKIESCKHYLIQLDDIGVPHKLKNVDFASNPLHIGLVFDFVLFENLDCHFFACDQVRAQSHFAEGAFSQGPAYTLANTLVTKVASYLPTT